VSLQGGKTAPAEGKNIIQGANTIETIKKRRHKGLNRKIPGFFRNL
jgi:hypothetical protein